MSRGKREQISERKLNLKKVAFVIFIMLIIIVSVIIVINKDKIFSNKNVSIKENNNVENKIDTEPKEKTIEEILTEFGGETIEQPKSDTYIVKKEGKEYTIYSDGEIVEGRVNIWNGQSKAISPDAAGNYNIYTAEEFKWFADKVINGEKNFSGSTITLRANIDFGGRQKEDGTWEGINWTAIIGFLDELPDDNKNKTNTTKENETKENLKRFAGCLDGNGFCIRGLYTETEKKYQGLFGYSSGTIQNLTLKNSYISGKEIVGGLVGINGGTIQNCKIENSIIKGENKVGGITGMSMTSSTIRQASTQKSKITGKTYVGGIVGYLNNNATISETSNNSEIIGENYIGGLAGISFYGTSLNTNSNSGKIKGNEYVGGIVGYSDSQIERNINEGNVIGKKYTGGLVGVNHTMADISKSFNSGNVEGESNVGGIAGANNTLISNCYNKGNIKSTDYRAGGICGQNSTESYVYTSYNIGKIEGEKDVDGIAGGNFGTITNSFYLDSSLENGSESQKKNEEQMKNSIITDLGSEFKADSNNINNEYPILNWQ